MRRSSSVRALLVFFGLLAVSQLILACSAPVSSPAKPKAPPKEFSGLQITKAEWRGSWDFVTDKAILRCPASIGPEIDQAQLTAVVENVEYALNARAALDYPLATSVLIPLAHPDKSKARVDDQSMDDELQAAHALCADSKTSSQQALAEEVATSFSLAMYESVGPRASLKAFLKAYGSLCEEISRSEVGGTSTVAYSCRNADGSNAIFMFQNGAQVQRSQYGLR